MVINLDPLPFKVGEDVFITHEEVASYKDIVKVHRGIVSVVLCHQLQDSLHCQTLRQTPLSFLVYLFTDDSPLQPEKLNEVFGSKIHERGNRVSFPHCQQAAKHHESAKYLGETHRSDFNRSGALNDVDRCIADGSSP